MITDKPKDYADTGLDEARTIGQLNSWKDGSLAAYDGMMSAKAKAGSSHSAGAMKWKATTTGTVYFALKVGTNKTSFSYTFDNFTLTDLTDIETGLGDTKQRPQDSQVYNLSGQPIGAHPTHRGLYIVSNGQHTKKVMVR